MMGNHPRIMPYAIQSSELAQSRRLPDRQLNY
jgi:hypothetical protein